MRRVPGVIVLAHLENSGDCHRDVDQPEHCRRRVHDGRLVFITVTGSVSCV